MQGDWSVCVYMVMCGCMSCLFLLRPHPLPPRAQSVGPESVAHRAPEPAPAWPAAPGGHLLACMVVLMHCMCAHMFLSSQATLCPGAVLEWGGGVESELSWRIIILRPVPSRSPADYLQARQCIAV